MHPDSVHPLHNRTRPALVLFAAALLGGLAAGGCSAQRSPSPYATPRAADRDPSEAERLNRAAAELMDADPRRAEALLRQALTHDIYCGPAHNNLGILHLKAGRLYEAATEFEWARKLIPGSPEPRLNLALVLEQAGRYDDAMDACRTALEIAPDHIAAIQALAKLQVRTGRTCTDTPHYLQEISLRGESDAWRRWARSEMVKHRP